MTATWTSPPISTDLISVSVTRTPSGVHLTVAGEVDSSSAPDLRACLDAALRADVLEIVVDLAGVTFLDSAGLCVLAAAHRQATAQASRLRVLAASRAVIRPLEITGLWKLLGAERVQPEADPAG